MMSDIKVSGAFASRRLEVMSPSDRAAMLRRAGEKISAAAGVVESASDPDQSEAQDKLRRHVTSTKASLIDTPYLAESVKVSDPRVVGKYSRGGLSGQEMGVLLMRRPSQAEIEMGANGDDIIFLPPSAGASPFPSPHPVGFSLLGADQAGAGVTQEEIDTQVSVPLYGDLNDVLNRIVSGAARGVGYVRDKLDWDKMSPLTKTVIGAGGAAATIYGLGRLMPNTMYYQLGRASASGGGAQDGNDRSAVAGVFTPSTVAERAVSSSSRGVSREAELEALGRTVYPVANNFIAGAYAIGKSFHGRRSQPSFGMLGGDPALSWKAMRGLRTPRFYWDGSRLLKTSAPYAVRVLPLMSPNRVATWLEDHPLSGGVFKDIASSALEQMGDALKGVMGKVKEWGASLVAKLKNLFKKIFSRHTHYPARYYSVSVTPAYLAAKFWSLLGKIPEATVDAWYNQMEADVKRISEGYRRDGELDEAGKLMINSLLGDMEKVRIQSGIPSQTPWTESPSLDVIQQYAPQTAKHFASLKDAKSNDWVDAFGTRNPVVVFADPAAMESDLAMARQEIEQALGSRQVAQDAGSGTSSDSGDAITSSSSTVVGIGVQGQNSHAGIGAVTPINTPSDPTILAQQIVMESGGSASDVPRAWLDQLPLNVKREMGLSQGDDSHFDTLVGEPVCSWMRPSNGDSVYAGSPALVSAAISAAKSWLVPTLMALVPWNKVAGWFKKNATKAKLLLRGSKTSSIASNASKSSGFVAALPNALKTIAKRGGAVASAVVGFCARHPKLTGLTALLGACFMMGSSYSSDKKILSSLLDLLKRALRELSDMGTISEDDAVAHMSALEIIDKNGFDKLSEKEAQELQTVAVMCYVTASYLASGGTLTQERYPALYELRDIIDDAANDMKANATSEDLSDLERFAVAVVEDVAATSKTPSSASGAASPGASNVAAVDPTVLAAVTAAGGSLAASSLPQVSPTGSGASASDVDNKSSVVAAGSGAASSTPIAQQSAVTPQTAASGEYSDVLGSLTDAQVDELTTLVDASQSMSEQDLLLEESGGTSRLLDSAKELCLKWGLPVAAASAIVALVIAAIRARRKGQESDAYAGSWLDKVNAWWSNVTGTNDPSLGSSLGNDVTGVAL